MSEIDQRYLDHKAEQRFAQLDYDGNGFIEWSDYQSEALDVLRHFSTGEDSARGQAVIRAYREKWDDLVTAVDTDGDGRISLEEYKAHTTDANYRSTRANHLNRAIGNAIMDLADSDGDGRISLEEFRKFPTPARAGAERAAEAFQRLDTDGDGYVSREEVHEIMEHYLSSSDHTDLGNQIFGNIAPLSV